MTYDVSFLPIQCVPRSVEDEAPTAVWVVKNADERHLSLSLVLILIKLVAYVARED